MRDHFSLFSCLYFTLRRSNFKDKLPKEKKMKFYVPAAIVAAVYLFLFLRSCISPRDGWIGVRFFGEYVLSALCFGRDRTLFIRKQKYELSNKTIRALIFARRLNIFLVVAGFAGIHSVLPFLGVENGWGFAVEWSIAAGFASMLFFMIPLSARDYFGEREVKYFKENWQPASWLAALGGVAAGTALNLLKINSNVRFFSFLFGAGLLVWVLTYLVVIVAFRDFARYRRGLNEVSVEVARTSTMTFVLIAFLTRLIYGALI